jgi:hypothetical protein
MHTLGHNLAGYKLAALGKIYPLCCQCPNHHRRYTVHDVLLQAVQHHLGSPHAAMLYLSTMPRNKAMLLGHMHVMQSCYNMPACII